MPAIILWPIGLALGGLGVKFLGDGVESASDASVKLAGAALLGTAAYVLVKGRG